MPPPPARMYFEIGIKQARENLVVRQWAKKAQRLKILGSTSKAEDIGKYFTDGKYRVGVMG